MFFNNIPMCSDKIKYAYARRVQYFSMIETFSPPFCILRLHMSIAVYYDSSHSHPKTNE